MDFEVLQYKFDRLLSYCIIHSYCCDKAYSHLLAKWCLGSLWSGLVTGGCFWSIKCTNYCILCWALMLLLCYFQISILLVENVQSRTQQLVQDNLVRSQFNAFTYCRILTRHVWNLIQPSLLPSISVKMLCLTRSPYAQTRHPTGEAYQASALHHGPWPECISVYLRLSPDAYDTTRGIP